MQEIQVKVSKHAHRRFYVMWYVDPCTEKCVQRSTGETNQSKALRKAAEWELELRSGGRLANWRIDWQSFRDRYEDEKLAGLSSGMQHATENAFNHLERVLNPKRLAGITAEALSRFQAQLRSEGLKETTIACYLRHIRAALSWAVSMRLLGARPKIDMPRIGKGRMMRGRPITTEEFERMLAAVPKVRRRQSSVAEWRRYLRGLWLSGLRLEESLTVSWDAEAPFAVDLTGGRRPRFRIYAEAHKGRRDELLPMTPDFAAFLEETAPAARHGLLFPFGLASGTVSTIVSRIGEAAGVVIDKAAGQYATAHDLRRSFGTRWSSKVKPATLQRLMRHRSIDTTLRYYVAQEADDIADELWSAYNPLTPGTTHPTEAGNDAS